MLVGVEEDDDRKLVEEVQDDQSRVVV